MYRLSRGQGATYTLLQLDERSDGAALRARLGARTGQTSVPSIFIGGEYVGYETVLVGGVGSPGVWGRAAAFLGRSGQALFAADEARLQVYVDDPWSIWRGSEEQRRRNLGILLLWWRVLGPPISRKKVQIGSKVRWIGVEVRLVGKGFQIGVRF